MAGWAPADRAALLDLLGRLGDDLAPLVTGPERAT
jgi:hypothetical protein